MLCKHISVKRLDRSTRHWNTCVPCLSTSSTSLHTRGNCRDTRTRHIACRRATAESAACDQARRWNRTSARRKRPVSSSVRYAERTDRTTPFRGGLPPAADGAQPRRRIEPFHLSGEACDAPANTRVERVSLWDRPRARPWDRRCDLRHGCVCAAARLRNHASSPSTIASAYAS